MLVPQIIYALCVLPRFKAVYVIQLFEKSFTGKSPLIINNTFKNVYFLCPHFKMSCAITAIHKVFIKLLKLPKWTSGMQTITFM